MRGQGDARGDGGCERDRAADAEAPSDQAHRLLVAEFDGRCDGGDEHELAADEEADRDDVQEANDRPGLHRSRAARRRACPWCWPDGRAGRGAASGRERCRHEQSEEHRRLGSRVMSRELDDQIRPLSATASRAMTRWKRPIPGGGQVERPDDLPAEIGVRAAALRRAGVADAGPGAVADRAGARGRARAARAAPPRGRASSRASRRRRSRPCGSAAAPVVCADSHSSTNAPHVRKAQPAASRTSGVSEPRCGRLVLPARRRPGSSTTVKRMSSGSSSVKCFTVCRMPR